MKVTFGMAVIVEHLPGEAYSWSYEKKTAPPYAKKQRDPGGTAGTS
jgi:hypothetical protein